jgi:hypothetical protein
MAEPALKMGQAWHTVPRPTLRDVILRILLKTLNVMAMRRYVCKV